MHYYATLRADPLPDHVRIIFYVMASNKKNPAPSGPGFYMANENIYLFGPSEGIAAIGGGGRILLSLVSALRAHVAT